MTRTATLAALLACLLPLHAGAGEAPVDDRTSTYREYREAFDAGDYARALPLAARVVDMTAMQYGPEEPELANPLTNLATTLYRMRQYGDALDTYRRALTILDVAGNPTDARLVAPLHGLGLTLRAMQRDDEAIVPLKRAVDIIRNRDGLHAPAQLPILRELIQCLEKNRRNEDAGREHLYAYNVAEQSFGTLDPRMIPVVTDLARWYEKTGRYAAARRAYQRVVVLADREQPNSLRAVEGLRGVARTYRLSYVFPETQDGVMASFAELPSSLAQGGGMPFAGPTTSGEGEISLRNALARLERTGTAGAAQRGAVLIDLGDWYRIAGVGQRALSTWGDAWKELSTVGDTSALSKPEPIVYRPPQVAVSQRQQDPDEYMEQVVEVRLAIGANGEVRDATIANPAPERESAERAVISALRRATWRPAFAGGLPVASTDYIHREPVYVRRPQEEARDSR